MRYFLVVLMLCVVAFAATFNGPAWSQRRHGNCDQAVSTANALECVNRNNQDVQNRMSATFKALVENQKDASRALLSDAQKEWILYRDSHCAWEAGLTDTPALKRVYELSCLTAMTEQRISLLENINEREEQPEPREFSAQPRWMNALAHDYPDIFWRYGEYKSADMDCDGVDEQIMTGISVVHVDAAKKGAGDADTAGVKPLHEVEVIISISENPETGRPKAQLLRLPVNKAQNGAHLCRPAIKLEVQDRPDVVADAETEAGGGDKAKETGVTDVKSCKKLQINDGSCAPVMVIWTGKEYAFDLPVSKEDAL